MFFGSDPLYLLLVMPAGLQLGPEPRPWMAHCACCARDLGSYVDTLHVCERRGLMLRCGHCRYFLSVAMTILLREGSFVF